MLPATLNILAGGNKMKYENKPMGLDKLPDYLKSLKENENLGNDACFVDMGMIKPVFDKWKWIQRIVLASAISTIVGTTGLVTHDYISTKQLTVVVDLNKDVNPQAIPQMITDSGGTILAVKQQEGSSAYEVKVSTRKSRKLFLEWLQKNKNVKEAK